MEYQALLKAARERLRGCQESQAFGDALQGVWAWLEEIQERLGTVDSTIGTKEQLEKKLETVQVRHREWRTICLKIYKFPFASNMQMFVFTNGSHSFLLQQTQEGAVCFRKHALILCLVPVSKDSALFAQDILLLKGEGEVKLNMVMGKAELTLRNYGAGGQEGIRSQLQEVEDAWATLLVTAMSCHRYPT